MDENETIQEFQDNADTVSSIDKALMGIGVALLAFLPTFAVLLFRPTALSANLSLRTPKDGQGKPLLRPGLFFVVALLSFVFVLNLVSSGKSGGTGKQPKSVQDNAAFDIGYAAAKGFDRLVDGLVTGLASGNVWGAVMVAFPIYLFAIALAMLHYLPMKAIARSWTAELSVGVSLYIAGGLLGVINLIGIIIIVAMPLAPQFAMGIVLFVLILAALAGTAFQSYNLSAPHVDVPDHHLVLMSIWVPFALIGLFLLLIIVII